MSTVYAQQEDAGEDESSSLRTPVELKIVTSAPYNAEDALERPDVQILIVNSKSCVEAAKKHIRSVCPLTWTSVDYRDTDWSFLNRRQRKEALLWPDNDLESLRIMNDIGCLLMSLGYVVKILLGDLGKKQGWNLSYAANVDKWNSKEIIKWAKDNKIDFRPEVTDYRVEKKTDEVIDEDYIAFWNQEKWEYRHWSSLGLKISKNEPFDNISNISFVLDRIVEHKIWYDTFLRKIMTEGPDGDREWSDYDDIRLTIDIQRRCGLAKSSKERVSQAVIEYAMRNTRDCLKEYLEELKWDGIPRISTAFVKMFGVEENSYNCDVSSNFFKSMAARGIKPGVKCDTMLVLEGDQGIGKSTCLEILAGEWYMVMNDSPDSHDFAMAMSGKWLCEIAEMHAFTRADVRSVKRTLSTAKDTYRPPYGTHAKTFPRQSVLAGSTNHDDWMGDDTGGRRFWPIRCEKVDLEWTRMNRDQLFAEAVALLTGETSKPKDKKFWEFSDRAAEKVEQMKRFAPDIWQDRVLAWLNSSTDAVNDVSLSLVMDKALLIPIDQQDRRKEMRVSSIMRTNGWMKFQKRINENRTVNRWRRMTDEEKAKASDKE